MNAPTPAERRHLPSENAGRPRLAWWRNWSVQGSFEPAGQQWTGWMVCHAPWLRATYEPEARSRWITEEPPWLNTNPYLFGLLVGVRQSVDEEQGPEVGRRVSRALQSALGALGDALMWTALRPLAVLLAALGAVWAGWIGVLAGWVAFAVGQAWLRDWSYRWGRSQGVGAVTRLETLPLRRITELGRRIAGVAAGALVSIVVGNVVGRPHGTEVDPGNWIPVGLVVFLVGVLAWRRRRGESAVLVAAAVLWVAARWGIVAG